MEKRKNILSVCVALALSNNVYAEDLSEANKQCPQNISSLSKAEKQALPEECKNENWGWAAGGIAALAIGVAIGVENNGGGSSHHNEVPPTPSDDGSDVTPPDDGGDVTPPDDGGDVTPPDDGSDVTPPDDGGDVTPPDDGGDVTPPDDGGDVTPPDDGGDVTPPDTSTTQYNNGVTLDRGAGTVTFDTVTLNGESWNNVTFSYVQDGDNYILTAPDGRTLIVNAKAVTSDGNAVMEGTQGSNGGYWKYDSQGNFSFANPDTDVISGDNQTNAVDTDSSATGTDAIGTLISGDGSENTLNGDVAASDGATGTMISGDGTSNTLNGDVAASDGATGTMISGDGTSNALNGDITASDGATGTMISGDGTDNTLNGDVAASDGGTGTVVSGDDTTTTVSGNIYASGTATGLYVAGDNATVTNKGSITAVDTDSIGVVISGANASFSNTGTIDSSLNGTGVSITGDNATTLLDGTVNVHAELGDDGVYQGATGVAVAGNDGNMTIAGDINVTGTMADDNAITPAGTLTGTSVSGTGNTVTLDGAVNISLDEPVDHNVNNGFTATGIAVTGSNNTVNIEGGVNVTTSFADTIFDGSNFTHNAYGITIDGDNSVSVSGSSSINFSGSAGAKTGLAIIRNGGHLTLNTDSTIDATLSNTNGRSFGSSSAIILASDANSSVENNGVINADFGLQVMLAQNGATVGNSGQIIVSSSSTNPYVFQAAVIRASGKSSQAMNESNGVITMTSSLIPTSAYGAGILPIKWSENTGYALLATDYGEVENQVGATINLQGVGLYGVAASKGTASNAGTINVDGFVPTVDENGTVTDKTFWQDTRTSYMYTMSAGVIVGSTDSGDGDASGINTGTINVNNEGFGMLALNGGTVTNQGTINLTADEGVTSSASNQLIGMGVINGGSAINDQTGTINIDADFGQAFYNDGTGAIFNYGVINLNGSEMAADDSHTGSQPNDEALLSDVITSAGKTQTLDSATGFISSSMGGANYGSTTLNGDLKVMNWLWNEGTGSVLNVNGDITVNQGLENEGTLTADTITTKSNAYNRAGATITVDTFSSPQFFNEGTFTGTVDTAGGSYSNNLVNSGTMTVVQDGRAAFTGTANIYNQAGATITNTGQAVTGGENTLIHITRTGGADTVLVNDGTLLAQNGYSAIIADQSSTSSASKWFINSETGVISGTNPETALIQIGRGYNFANDGTISVQGDNAVAINGAGTSYIQYLVNSGTLNVGTEEGQKDGTNGSGLIGIKGNGKGTVINNAADGVINVYADDSYAFGGTTKQIINNGEVNLLCDTGCGLYAPGTAGTQNDHNGTADLTVATAATAPSQGTVPDAPEDPSSSSLQAINNYTVGTNADGSAGVLKANNVLLSGASINTGFTAGTDATTMTFDNVVTGSNIQGADSIASTSVVWNAQGSNDASGNVDVTMTKNAYADVATDGSVSSVASALDSGYTNNELYSSLNVSTTAQLNNALRQISGSQATSVFNEARMLSNRFDMLADAAPVLGNGLAMNLVAKGDPRAELGKNTKYDMLALRQKLELTDSQSVSLEYGIARLDGDSSTLAGDNSITGGYSQFFGLQHQMTFDNGISWDNALRYDVHNLDSNRAVSYDSVSKSADSSMRQQYLELRSSGAKKFELSEGLTVMPYAGVKLRHTLEDGYNERNAGDFNLNMNSGSETAVDGIAGLKLDYAGKNGWSAMGTLEGGPNLSYAKSQRSATLAGAGSQSFNVDDGQKGGGINSLATMGVKYSSKDSTMQMEAFHWKEDGINDKGLMMNYKVSF